MIKSFTLFILWLFHTFVYKWVFLENSKHIWKRVFTFYCRTFRKSLLFTKGEFLCKLRTKLHIKITVYGIRKIPPRWIPTWVRVRIWVRVRLGGIWSGGIHQWELTRGGGPSTQNYIARWGTFFNFLIQRKHRKTKN